MSNTKPYRIIGIVFVLILGTLSHFFYQWSGNQFIVGLFSPVNESVWEHMKLIFFPMLLYLFIIIPFLRPDSCSLLPGYFTGMLVGTLLIPILFYAYTSVLGYNLPVFDITIFIFSTVLAFFIAFHSDMSCKVQKSGLLPVIIVLILVICFMVFSYQPPDLMIFKSF